MDVYFKNIRLVSPAQEIDEIVNIRIKDGEIIHCGATEPAIDKDTQVINSEKFICSPGLFDMHVHLRDPGQEYKETIETGCNAAANGGFTGVVCMPNTNPTIDNIAVVELIKNKSKNLPVDVFISAAITANREGKALSPMFELNDAGVVMFTDDGTTVMNSNTMRRVFDYSATKDLLIAQHCEDHNMTDGFAMDECEISDKLGLRGFPSVAEEIIISRDIMLSEYCGNRRYHAMHVSTRGGVRIIRNAKKRGLRVSCEVMPHHFSLSHDLLTNYDTNLKMDPPLRSVDDIAAMVEGLKDGTIDVIASDHAPHALHEKEVEFENAPCGIIGLETSLGLSLNFLVHTGALTINQLIEKMSVNPRKILGLPQIMVKEGEIANLTVFALNEEWVVDKKKFKSKSGNTPFAGQRLIGKPKFIINHKQFISSEL
ncbi:MAG: dihydroorotase [Bacteroidota bacterium]|nr:dihydroorotase [Bacteroidota bacterium]